MTVHWRTLLSVTGVLALLACSPAAPSTGGTTSAPSGVASPSTQGSSVAQPSATARPAASPRPAVQNGTMRIELFEWSISPDPFEVAPGIYRAEVVNMGRRAHDLIVAGETEIQTRRLNPGQTQMVTFVLKAGETPMWCSIGDHRDMGMEAYIQVN